MGSKMGTHHKNAREPVDDREGDQGFENPSERRSARGKGEKEGHSPGPEIGAVRGARWRTDGRQRSEWEVRQTENREKIERQEGGRGGKRVKTNVAHCDGGDFSVRVRERERDVGHSTGWEAKDAEAEEGKEFCLSAWVSNKGKMTPNRGGV